jgi:hypothetical protein
MIFSAINALNLMILKLHLGNIVKLNMFKMINEFYIINKI